MATYLDHNASTPLDRRVVEKMEPWLVDEFGNASSRDHASGWDAAEAVDEARAAVADATGAPDRRVTFVSGATEALNTVLRSYVGFADWNSKTIVACETEHDAVLAPIRYLHERTGVRVTVLPVDRLGRIEPERLRSAVVEEAGALVALMAANNEIGTLHPVKQIAELVHAANGVLLCDTTQALGRVAVEEWFAAVDFATVSGHKIYGPKGVGALLAPRQDVEFEPLILGGAQERSLRGGTLNVPGIVGLGEACRLVREHWEEDVRRMNRLRDRLEEGIQLQLADTWVNGDRANRLCNTSNMGFKGVDARTMIRDMYDIAVSTRSACSSGDSGPSHVLKAIGLSDQDAYSCIRFSVGRFTTEEEIDYAIDKVVASAHKLRRNKSPRT